jgi:predicted house-cleaning noncanonical NTP pyrophosphatase (MazG superfamily)
MSLTKNLEKSEIETNLEKDLINEIAQAVSDGSLGERPVLEKIIYEIIYLAEESKLNILQKLNEMELDFATNEAQENFKFIIVNLKD